MGSASDWTATRRTGRRRLYGATAAILAVSLGASSAIALGIAASATARQTTTPAVSSGNADSQSHAQSSGS
ncbi:hypothetical protein [Fodinicola acaciae]|uniref:hypothetical protein n=1 Tax=Fodinicola acaciae TaxID=2681555 RepID=UPI0013D592F5|nr:hypothetical protein [Fodinicola acaciae]